MAKEYSVYELNRIQQYIMQMRPVLKKEALFSDGTKDYRDPTEPEAGEKVTIRFRTGRNNVDIVWLCTDCEHYKMKKTESDREFDYYAVEMTMGEEPFYYYFEVASGLLHVFFDRYGVSKERRDAYRFCIIPGFSTPEWSKGAVMYQILVDRFYNGDPANDVLTDEYYYIQTPSKKMEDWNQCPSDFSVGEFYGGDLEGVRQKLHYLQNLGVEVIYFNPLFVSPSNHKYDIQDYDHIDPHYGKIVVDEGELLQSGTTDNSRGTRYVNRVTNLKNLEASNAFFAELVREIHARGMKVILDGVFNHCGSFNKWLDREKIYHANGGYEDGAFLSKESPYRSFFGFRDENGWPDNTSYEGWWDYDTLPKLNYEESRQLYDYILHIGRKWVSPPYNADGWRLDVAADLGQSEEFNHQFWRDFRTAVKEANPEAIILAEHYDDAGSWLMGDQWDTIMNYSAFMEPVTWFLTGMEKHSDERRGDLLGNTQAFVDAMVYHMSRFQYPSLMVSMNELSNHDHSRFLTRTNQTVGRTASLGPEAANQNINKGIMRAAVMIQMTWPGAPTLYYGDEAGLCGWTDPDNRRTYPWGREDQELIQYHRDIIAIHKTETALMRGSLKYLHGGFKVICYGRFTDTEKMIVLINAGFDEVRVKISVWEVGVTDNEDMVEVIMSNEEGYTMEKKVHPVTSGVLDITLPRVSSILLKSIKKS